MTDPQKPKTQVVHVAVEVPVNICGRCGKEKASEVIGHPLPDGTIRFRIRMLFKPLIVGKTAIMLCDDCFKFVEGAVNAMGLKFPKNDPPS